MRFPTIAILATLALAGCATYIPLPSAPLTPEINTAAQQGVKGSLRDPDSAQFGYMTAYQRDATSYVVCGQVNAKNGFGGYSGMSPFYVIVLSMKRDDGHMTYVGSNAVIATPDETSVFYGMFPMCAQTPQIG